MDRGHLTRVMSQLGYCGIWCGSCVVGSGALMELARRYREMLDSHGIEDWGAQGFDYAEFVKGLESISKLEVCTGCLSGGGRDDCELRLCAQRRQAECVDCDSFGDCTHGELLDHMRTGARQAGMVVIDTSADKQSVRSDADSELARRWWWRALFLEEG